MSRQEAEQSAAEDPDLEARVAEYLVQNPTFFDRNPQVLAALEVPHASGGAVSLIEQQVRLLRSQLEAERNRLTHLISRAREYESLSGRLHNLVLKLIAAQDSEQVCDLLKDALLSEFSAEAMTLKLFQAESETGSGADPLTLSFRDFLDRHHALCGPLDCEKARILFGAAGAEIRSAALVPVRADGHAGVLAIGSHDAERFRADMATDLLDRLGEILGQKLRVMPLGHCDEGPEVISVPSAE
ncbi:MAG: DUF484 family protein [Thiocapsa sp.]|nr:DUF484 family protein [Thiocapsa sp.]MCG6898043.1 DUF484 family protein [Thiocapsa sp.]MCG6985365.1 DUF484 family protein [Thiocapsa sp.]